MNKKKLRENNGAIVDSSYKARNWREYPITVQLVENWDISTWNYGRYWNYSNNAYIGGAVTGSVTKSNRKVTQAYFQVTTYDQSSKFPDDPREFRFIIVMAADSKEQLYTEGGFIINGHYIDSEHGYNYNIFYGSHIGEGNDTKALSIRFYERNTSQAPWQDSGKDIYNYLKANVGKTINITVRLIED